MRELQKSRSLAETLSLKILYAVNGERERGREEGKKKMLKLREGRGGGFRKRESFEYTTKKGKEK